jgi:hypothetical protein
MIEEVQDVEADLEPAIPRDAEILQQLQVGLRVNRRHWHRPCLARPTRIAMTLKKLGKRTQRLHSP